MVIDVFFREVSWSYWKIYSSLLLNMVRSLSRTKKQEFSKAFTLVNAYVLLPCIVSPGVHLSASNQSDKGAKLIWLPLKGYPSPDTPWLPFVAQKHLILFLIWTLNGSEKGTRKQAVLVNFIFIINHTLVLKYSSFIPRCCQAHAFAFHLQYCCNCHALLCLHWILF